MSSTPPASGTGYDSQDNSSSPTSTPPSSPPSAAMSDKGYEPVSEAMLAEEKRMKEESRRREARDKQKAQAEDEVEKEAKYKKLMNLVDSSKVCCQEWRCAQSIGGSFLADSPNPSCSQLFSHNN